ncbi:hypothetical protein [Ktedonospora formicarum]|uniref:DUF4386 family protein n=1 Tax=Ktedonospora formicarum TaxID=2778364 RepID=A0A8J3I263_9CHLR|nr:hypothetical protein [Ktedonospora formicarum]GHO46231.1 hypothetical protein KSX_43940 [Ktedonospora formicarum]
MSITTVQRLCGIVVLAGCAILLAGIIPAFFNSDPNSILTLILPLLSMFGAMLTALGLPGIYASIRERIGIIGLIGYILSFFWLLITLSFEPIVALVMPFLSFLVSKSPNLANVEMPSGLFTMSLIGNILFLVGGTLLGIAVLRSSLTAKLAGAVMAVGALITFIGNFLPQFVANIGTMIFLAGLIWLTVRVMILPSVKLDEEVEPSAASARA